MSDDIAGRLSLFILLISLLASHRHLVNDMCVQPRDHVAGYRNEQKLMPQIEFHF